MRFPFDPTGTIGSMPCERSLNSILAEKADSKLIKKVTKLLQIARHRLKMLEFIPEKATREYFRVLLKHDMERCVEKITGFQVRGVPVTDALASHMMCCLHAYFAKDKNNAVEW